MLGVDFLFFNCWHSVVELKTYRCVNGSKIVVMHEVIACLYKSGKEIIYFGDKMGRNEIAVNNYRGKFCLECGNFSFKW